MRILGLGAIALTITSAGVATASNRASPERPAAAPLEGPSLEPHESSNGETPPSPEPTEVAGAVAVGDNQSGASSQAISVPQGAGKVQGMGESFSAQLSTGIATFAVPIHLPSARGGAQPALSLSYSSAAGAGLAGVGWSIGVAFIARQTDRGVPRYQDPPAGGAWTPAQDRFVFGGGQELVPIGLVHAGACPGAIAGEVMPAWAEGWQYFRARVEGDFLRFFWSPDHRTWRVQAKSGVSFELGAPLDAPNDGAALETAPGDATKVFRWNLVRQYDPQGPGDPAAAAVPHPANLVTYRWSNAGGVGYLSDVYDTPLASAAGATTTPALASYAHHAHLLYEARPDPSSSSRRGYRTQSTLRIVGVDVTSKPFTGGASAARQLVERYHFAYDPAYHVSLLARVQVEGRCASPIAEDATGALPATSCPTLPAMTFDYSHVAGVSDVPGFEAFDDTLRPLASSPPFSLGARGVELFDVDADSLPDLLVTSPAVTTAAHQVFLNGAGGAAGAFAAATPMAVDGSLGGDATVITLGNRHVGSLDVDGDGTADLFHTPANLTPSIYSAQKGGGALAWVARAMATPSAAGRPVDFGDPRVRVADVDGDGLVDVLQSNGSAYSTLFSLGRYPGGDGAYGTATWTGATTASLSSQPATSCMPWSGTPVRLDDGDVSLADMDGDGLVDLVRVRFGDVKYWPGDGRGRFGIDLYDASGRPMPCPGDTFAEGRHVAMAGAPQLPGLQASQLRLDDVNGDGRDDLVRVRADAVDVWLNVDGAGWTDRHVVALAGAPASPTDVRLVDVDGSGTRDVVFGEGGDYRYVDLLGGQRPWVLTRVSNGLGKTTELAYATSTQMMLAAAAAGQPWTSTAPIVSHVVSRVTERDNLPVAGRPAGVYVREYTYRDPLFDGRQRELRGFAHATVKTDGDADTLGDTTSSDLILGACAPDPADASGLPSPCTPAGRWRDNPREALKGLPVVAERFDDGGAYLSTAHTQYTLRKLYAGLDGRGVWQAYATRTDTWLYDDGKWVGGSDAASVADVVGDAPRTIALRSTSNRAQTATTGAQDLFGETTAKVDLGCVAGTCTVDEALTSAATPARIPEGSGWMYRAAETWVQGKDLVKRHWIKATYDTHGNPIASQAVLVGTLPLVRSHETGAAVAPPPATASVDGTIDQGHTTYDPFGNATRHTGPDGRCQDRVYDADYAQLVVAEVVHAGAIDATTGCGATALMQNAVYDRGEAAVTDVVGENLESSHVDYDGFGRVVAVTKPDPATGAPSPLPSVVVTYDLPADPAARPYSVIHSRTLDGPDGATSSYRDGWAITDGMGRAVVTFDQADPSADDGGQWVVRGLTDRDAKGAARRVFLAWFWSGDPRAYLLATPPATSYARTRYDAFGRVVETDGYDKQIASQTVFHALSQDLFDAAAVVSKLPVTIYSDGHGRTYNRTEHYRNASGTPLARYDATYYLPSGEVFEITRVASGAPAVARWMGFDTLGRMVLNVDANTSKGYVAMLRSPLTSVPATLKAWRYAYDDAGDLVGTSDARGCGVSYAYDAAGRKVAEDDSPCKADQAPYSAPNLATGDGTEVFYRYDAIDGDAASVTAQEPSMTFDAGAYAGRVASITDRGAKSIVAYDRRGRITGTARRIARPGAPSAALASRFASRWYAQTTSYDGADRVVDASTGARVPELLAGGASSVHVQYAKSGAVARVGSSYGDLVAGAKHDADGLVLEERWADGAQTTTDFTYDARRRVATVQTTRAKAPQWSTSTPTYPTPGAATTQLVLEDTAFTYDLDDDPIAIADLRTASEWPAGAQPVSRTMKYDGLNRLVRVDSIYGAGDDAWTSPYAAEDAGGAQDPRRAAPSPHVAFDKRIRSQTYDYDWLGNTQVSGDDANGFYDRSLGAITNGAATDGAYQLRSATGVASTRGGSLTTRYDESGNLLTLAVVRQGPCLPAGAACGQRFEYGWDEAGRLVRARRWDSATPGVATDPIPTTAPDAELRYAYDASDARVLKTALDAQGNARYAAYVFGSLELRGAQFDGVDYERTAWTEVPYLSAHGARLGRVHYAGDAAPHVQSGEQHLLLEMPDHLGSTSIVIDRETGELVERSTTQAFGEVESDYRPARWGSFREDYRFTGKEEDIEVGIQYFGKRFYSPELGRWVSPDPLAAHAPGAADLNLYAYVHGKVFVAVDPNGLDGVNIAAVIREDTRAKYDRAATAGMYAIADQIRTQVAVTVNDVQTAVADAQWQKRAIQKTTLAQGVVTDGRDKTCYAIAPWDDASIRIGNGMDTDPTNELLWVSLDPAAGHGPLKGDAPDVAHFAQSWAVRHSAMRDTGASGAYDERRGYWSIGFNDDMYDVEAFVDASGNELASASRYRDTSDPLGNELAVNLVTWGLGAFSSTPKEEPHVFEVEPDDFAPLPLMINKAADKTAEHVESFAKEHLYDAMYPSREGDDWETTPSEGDSSSTR